MIKFKITISPILMQEYQDLTHYCRRKDEIDSNIGYGDGAPTWGSTEHQTLEKRLIFF